MSHIVIVGSGFASCTAIRTLRKKGFNEKITVISPKPELFYFPSLIWVPAGKRSQDDLIIPLASFYNRHNIDYIQGRVTGIDKAQKTLKTDADDLAYDAVIIASGGRYIRKLAGIENACIVCAGWDDTKAFSDKLAAMTSGTIAFGFSANPKEPSAMRGGPVFEFLFGVDTLLRQQGRRDKFELVFFSPAARPGQRLGDKAVERILGEMKKRNITTHLGSKIKKFTKSSIKTETTEFDAHLILFIPGMTGPAWAQDSGLCLSEGGFFKGTKTAAVENEEFIYAAGDGASFPGPDWKPKQAHMADLQAAAAAKNCISVLNNQPPVATFKTELICIIDTLNNGSLVFRSQNSCLTSFMVKMPPLHWAKVFFEKLYLKPYR